MAEKKEGKKHQRLTLGQIESQIEAAGYDWKAGQTSMFQLSDDEQDMRLGLEVPENEMERVKLTLSKEVKTFKFAPTCDWRKKNGENWVTPVRDQGACGSCVAFGTVATIECQAKNHYNKPNWDIDLSEADLFFCGAGRKCQQGWWPTYALDFAKNKGIPEEKCFPYKDHDMDCTPCSDRANRLIKIGKWQEIINIDQRKEWLDKKGPMIACMAVYRDFFSYKDGVYKHTTGDLAGYHAICCIGYNEDESCWICKNSWGTGWGKKGFFKIAYRQADIDTKFAMYGVEDITGTLKPPDGDEEDKDEVCDWAEHVVLDYSFTVNQRVLWAYIKGEWRYKLISDAQIAGIGSILFQASSVKACYQGKKLTKILGWKKLT